jgi:hypothetical protein
MNRRVNERRRVVRGGDGIYSPKTQFVLSSVTLFVSMVSLVISLSRSAVSSDYESSSSVVSPAEMFLPEEQQTEIQKFHSVSKPKPEVKKQSSKESATRSTRGPKRVRIVFEESVARAPAAEAPVSTGPKTIKYSNDLYEKEDLL